MHSSIVELGVLTDVDVHSNIVETRCIADVDGHINIVETVEILLGISKWWILCEVDFNIVEKYTMF